ncbi:EcsC family protein [Nocardioides rubriscoriae]|uniref:EcsC family protein n=1 Tax=Nocardioides rubriscoriae TaxID=642762 RepID=UPI0011DFA753|nr:EcsC family protein [Nocardioides rubriscoriae]
MGVTRNVGHQIGRQLAPRLTDLAPGLSSSFVREALDRAIAGVGPLPPIRDTVAHHLRERDGRVEKAVKDVVDQHIRYAGVSGFATNLGGVMTLAVALPANLLGTALVQCRMVAGVAQLRGYDLDDPRTHNAVLVTVLGEETVDRLVAKGTIPAPPMALATAPVHDARIDAVVSAEVARDLVARVTGRRLATTVGRRVPGLGGVVGMTADGWATYKIGSYAERELLPRNLR